METIRMEFSYSKLFISNIAQHNSLRGEKGVVFIGTYGKQPQGEKWGGRKLVVAIGYQSRQRTFPGAISVVRIIYTVAPRYNEVPRYSGVFLIAKTFIIAKTPL